MVAEMKKLEKLPSIKFETADDGRYTSLKDILPHSPTFITSTNYEGGSGIGLDSSNISIKNQLVKQAASAYLQSAMLANRHQHWMVRMWRKVTDRNVFSSAWNVYVRNPLRSCVGQILQFLASIIFPIAGVWNRRDSISKYDCEL